jgi:hypothetical protein
MPTEKRAHGVYSCKTKGNDKAADSFGKPYLFNCTLAPYYEAPRDARSVYKGKQMITKTHLPHFGKLEYAPEAYNDNTKKEKERKLGFATVREHYSGVPPAPRHNAPASSLPPPPQPPPSHTHTYTHTPAHLQGRPLNRDDLSSTLEVLRYRHHLLLENRMDAHHAKNSPPRAPSPHAAAQAASLSASAQLRTTTGLASVLPTFTNEFDRQRFVPEFATRRLPAKVKYERVFGTSKPVSTDIGEGAFNVSILKSPEQGTKKPGTSSIVHMAPPLLSPTMVA